MPDTDDTSGADPVDTEIHRQVVGGISDAARADPEPAGPPTDGTDQSGEPADDSVQALTQLRNLLLGPEQQEIETIRNRIDNSDLRADDIATVLPEAVARSAAKDDRLARALAPTIGSAIKTSVQKNPTPLVDAIFPIIGPAIRRSISDALAGMIQSLNQVMEHSFSIQGLRWRIQAARTGKPFAEVVLLNTLKYRVEQVFLIHAETGLLLHHVGVDSAHVADQRMVSGMITAIQSFVRDSFGGKDEHLDRMRVGGMVVRIERGPHAVLAAVIRGTPAAEVAQKLQETIEQIHLEFSDKLETFEGETKPFGDAADLLTGCLLEATQTRARPKVSPGLLITLIILAALIGLMIYWRVSRANHWSGYIDDLRSTPGLVVIEDDRGWFTHRLRGLRDPLAADPAGVLEAHDISQDRVDADWRMYQSLDPLIAALRLPEPADPEEALLRNANEVLAPPAGVSLAVSGTTVIATGDASHAWIVSAMADAKAVPGLGRLDLTAINDQHLARARALIDDLHSYAIPFGSGHTDTAPEQNERIAGIASRLIELRSLANDLNATVAVRVTGHSDPVGDQASRRRVSQARADSVLAVILKHNPGLPTITAVGVGASQPVRPDQPGEADRRVSFVVEFRQAERN